jgi:serine/threonine-protein kinase
MASSAVRTIHGGRYSMLGHLGGGHFGEVWRGRDNVQGDAVAIKLLGSTVTLDQALLEARLLTRLRQHDRIVTIRNVELAAPGAFIVMDFLPAGSVGARMTPTGIDLVDAVRWTRDALGGLAHAHDLGVVHRDVKPDNFLVDDAGRAVLSDFGIAEDTINKLLANSVVYWPHAAPEMATSGSSARSDIFAMGATLYRLMTGEYPFSDPAQAATGSFVDPHRLNPQIPMSVTRAVRIALAADPAARYPDARDAVRTQRVRRRVQLDACRRAGRR